MIEAKYRAMDRVDTPRGEGVIRHVFRAPIDGRNTYSVVVGQARVGVIFSEDELRLVPSG